MDTNLNINENIDTSSLIQGTLRKISSMAALNGQSSVIDQSQKAGFEAAARGFESLFVHTLIKEMKNAMLGDDEENKDLQFGANTLQGYTDLLFADHISKIGKGIGIASMLYKQMTGEELPTITERNPSFNIPISPYTKPEAEDISTGYKKQMKTINDVQPTILTSDSFLERMQSRLANYDDITREASRKYNIPEELIKAVITVESAGKPDAKSSAGAKGLMQLMDGTAKDLGVGNSYDPYQNIMGGAKYLRQMLDKFQGDVNVALAAYNAGPGNVEKYGGIPPFSETQSYVKKVGKYHEIYQNNMA